MTNDPEYVELFEALAVADADMADEARPVKADPLPGASAVEAESECTAAAMNMDQTEPVAYTTRTAAEITEISTASSKKAADEGRPTAPAPGTVAVPQQLLEAGSEEQLLQRALRMFGGGRLNLVASGGLTCVSEVTLALIMMVKAAITTLFKHHVAQLCSSPERPDLRLSQEEALGHLVGSLVVGEMLIAEARPVGKRLDFHAGKESKAQAADKESVRQKKKGLRKKKGLDPAELASQCETIDRDASTAQAARLAVVIDLALPDKKTVIVERKPISTICQGCTRSLRSDQPTPLQVRFGRPCPCVWGPDEDDVPEEPQPTSKGAVARAQAELERYSGPEVGRAIAIVDQLENLYVWLEEGEPVTDEQIEAQTQQYRLALGRLKAVAPNSLHSAQVRSHALETVKPRMADEYNSIPCPYGFGRIARWPWALHLPSLGFCDHFCHCGVIREARDRVVTASLGAWPEDVQIWKIW